MFELLSTAGSAAELAERKRKRKLIPGTCGPAQQLITDSIYMTEEIPKCKIK